MMVQHRVGRRGRHGAGGGSRTAGRRGIRASPQRGGFTILELSLVLVVIGLLLGAVSIGKDLQRNAEQQKIYAKFVQAWATAYNEYFARTGVVVGDSQLFPTLKVNGNTAILCDELPAPIVNAPPGNLYALMDAVGIEMPPGRAEGREARAVFLDSNGNPQEIQVCFQNVAWPDSNDVSLNNKNVMVLFGLTPDLARHLDATIDGRPDARFGLFRQATGLTTGPSREWDRNNTAEFGNVNNTARDESQIAVVTAFYRMNQ
jgi:prepilin-type N-terminal cleavage/methylation domain-containing protein